MGMHVCGFISCGSCCGFLFYFLVPCATHMSPYHSLPVLKGPDDEQCSYCWISRLVGSVASLSSFHRPVGSIVSRRQHWCQVTRACWAVGCPLNVFQCTQYGPVTGTGMLVFSSKYCGVFPLCQHSDYVRASEMSGALRMSFFLSLSQNVGGIQENFL